MEGALLSLLGRGIVIPFPDSGSPCGMISQAALDRLDFFFFGVCKG